MNRTNNATGGRARAASMTDDERRALARMAGKARAASMTAGERSELAKKARAQGVINQTIRKQQNQKEGLSNPEISPSRDEEKKTG